jgi:DtxR family transcriptional regulator, Mn-dependent transcriptional regulator
MTTTNTLTTTMEDYLEAIAWLVGDGGSARVRDIAAALKVHKSTVTAALRSLAEKRLVNYAAYEHATLTPAGRKIADDVIRRHEIVRGFFMQVLALDRDVADANACRMEHILDAEVLDRLASFAEFVKDCPSSKQRCLKQFLTFYQGQSRQTGTEENQKSPPAAQPKRPKARTTKAQSTTAKLRAAD